MSFKKRILPGAGKDRLARNQTRQQSGNSPHDDDVDYRAEAQDLEAAPTSVPLLAKRRRKGLLVGSHQPDDSRAKSSWSKRQSSLTPTVTGNAEADPQRYALLDKSFRSQGARLDNKTDPHMEAFVRERMIGKGLIQPNDSNETSSTANSFLASTDAPQSADYKDLLELAQKREAQLFQIPEALRVEDKSEEEVDKMGWLTGLVEFPLSIEDKLKNIEETEREKRMLLKQRMRMGNGDITISSIARNPKTAASTDPSTCTSAIEALLRNKPSICTRSGRDSNVDGTSSQLPGANLVRTAFGQRFQTFELRKTACATDDSVMDRFRKRMRRM